MGSQRQDRKTANAMFSPKRLLLSFIFSTTTTKAFFAGGDASGAKWLWAEKAVKQPASAAPPRTGHMPPRRAATTPPRSIFPTGARNLSWRATARSVCHLTTRSWWPAGVVPKLPSPAGAIQHRPPFAVQKFLHGPRSRDVGWWGSSASRSSICLYPGSAETESPGLWLDVPHLHQEAAVSEEEGGHNKREQWCREWGLNILWKFKHIPNVMKCSN